MTKKPAIVYISLDGMTDPLGQSQVLPYLGKLSSEYSIFLVSAEKPLRYQQLKSTIIQTCLNNNISWSPVVYEEGKFFLKKLKNPLKLFFLAYRLAKSNNALIIHCRSYIPALIGWFIVKRVKAKLLFDMRGFWADERIEGNLWMLDTFNGKLLYGFFKRVEKLLIKNSHAIITLTHAAKQVIETWNCYDAKIPITVIPCCADTDHFFLKKVNQEMVLALKEKLNLNTNHYVVTYLGSLGTWYMTDEMMKFFKLQLTRQPLSVFLIITPDPEELVYKFAQSANVPLESIRVYYAQRAEVPGLLSLSNYSIFFIQPKFSKIASSPTKLAELMAMGIPVVTNTGVGDVQSIINKTASGVCLNDFTESSMLEAIEKINSKSYQREEIREACIREFSLEVGVERYRQVYKYLCR